MVTVQTACDAPEVVLLHVLRGCRAPNGSRFPEDPVAAESSPANCGPPTPRVIDRRRPLPCRPAVGSAEAPRHLENAWDVHHWLHPQAGRPRRRILGFDESVTAFVERPSCFMEHLALILGQALVVGLERIGPFEFHDSRSSSSSSMSSATAMFPMTTASSASRSNRCQRSVQNQA